MMYKLTDLDVGIALCHLAVATEKVENPLNFLLVKERQLHQMGHSLLEL